MAQPNLQVTAGEQPGASIGLAADCQVDMGYDISDYKAIHEPYGSVEDVEELAKQLHARGMKLMLDLVVNHTSDEHDWFLESKSSKASSKRDWYIWRSGKLDGQGNRVPPNNWKTSLGGGSVWEWNEDTQEYYLHLYDVKQPGQSTETLGQATDYTDLNYENPDVRAAVYEMMHFWVSKGCDGFRVGFEIALMSCCLSDYVDGRHWPHLERPHVPGRPSHRAGLAVARGTAYRGVSESQSRTYRVALIAGLDCTSSFKK